MNPKGMQQTRRLREMLRAPGLVIGAGAHDALSARIVERAGFPLCFVTGAGVSMTHGYADVGLLSVEEVVATCRYVTEAVDIPVVADADNGYGNAINAMRTVRMFEQAGLAGIHIEDQVWPKRCGHMTGKRLIPKEEMVQKIRAALDARRDPEFVIFARCDALMVTGIDDTIERCEAYLAAGADVLWFETREDLAEIERMAGHFRGRAALHFNHSSSGMTPRLTLPEIEALGFKTVGYHAYAVRAATNAMIAVLGEIRQSGNAKFTFDKVGGFEDFYNIGGLAEIRALEKKYGV